MIQRGPTSLFLRLVRSWNEDWPGKASGQLSPCDPFHITILSFALDIFHIDSVDFLPTGRNRDKGRERKRETTRHGVCRNEF